MAQTYRRNELDELAANMAEKHALDLRLGSPTEVVWRLKIGNAYVAFIVSWRCPIDGITREIVSPL